MNHALTRNPHAACLPALCPAEAGCLRVSPACRVSGFSRLRSRAHVDGKGRLTQITDARDRSTEIKDRLDEASAYATAQAYDKKGNLTRVTDRNGKITALAYDGFGRLVAVTDPLGVNKPGQTTINANKTDHTN